MSTGTCNTTLGESGCIEDLQNARQSYPVPVLRANVGTRRKREFTPDAQKDCNYWLKRNRNNEAAKRSRQRKRLEEYLLETRAFELQRENEQLKIALSVVNHHNTSLNNRTNVGFNFPMGMSNDSCSLSFHVPRTLIPLHGRLQCLFSDPCGPVCARTNPINSVYDVVSYSGPENAVNTTKLSSIHLLDCHPPLRYDDGANACTRAVYPSNRSFTYENDAFEMSHYNNPVVSLSRINNCYRAKTSSETTLDCRRQPGLNGTIPEVPVETNASGDTFQLKTGEKAVLLPHKLRYKVNKARFVTKHLS